ncbi:MAG: hypothetical protein WCK48_03835 [bacterium]
MKKIIYAALAFSPVLALAQDLKGSIGKFTGIPETLKTLVNGLIPVFIALAVVYFFWGLIKFIQSAGDPKKTAEGKGIMIYGLIAIAIMVSLFGLITWLQNTTGVNSGGSITAPTIN